MTTSSASTYASELSIAAYALLQTRQQAISFSTSQKSGSTISLSGRSASTEDIVSLSTKAIMALAKDQGSSVAPAVEQAAQLTSKQALNNFAQIYAQHEADGVEGRFYKGTDPDTLASMMSPNEAASFKEAFKNHTLTIQTFEEAGVKSSGTETVTYSGGGMSDTGAVAIDATAVTKEAKYCLTSVDPMFGGYVVSWGGPPS